MGRGRRRGLLRAGCRHPEGWLRVPRCGVPEGVTVSDPQLCSLAADLLDVAEPTTDQLTAVRRLLEGHDVLLVAPTGTGKSLVFQLAAAAAERLCVVVTPLLSLAGDQVRGLDTSAGEGFAARWTSAESATDLDATESAVRDGTLRLLYTSPEQLEGGRLRDLLAEHPPALLAVDEAHCVSTWGTDFRPSYAALGQVREAWGSPPTVAVTATASSAVRKDVHRVLGLGGTEQVLGFERPDLALRVLRLHEDSERAGTVQERVRALREETGGGLGLVYVRTRRDAETLAAHLAEAGLRAPAYHAGLPRDRREEVHDAFHAGDVDVVVATSAFGMGVHQPEVRFVLHAQAPESLDVYYQESGRAGRDGRRAVAELLFRDEDLALGHFFAGGRPRSASVRRVAEAWREAPDADVRTLASTTGLGRRTVGRVLALLTAGGADPSQDVDRLADVVRRRAEAERTLRRTQVERVREYADSAHCRDLVLRHHFGDLSAEPCGRCDTCSAEGGAEPLETLRDLDGLRPESGVKHRRFGRGTITDLTRDTVTVLFDRVGYRTLATDLVRERQLLKPA